MKHQTVVIGMVLTSMPIGEYDKRLVILTKERGKITAFARGARKQNSTLMAGSQTFSFGEFMLYEGKDYYNVAQIKITNYFQELRVDLDTVYYACYFCEFAEYVTREGNDETEILKLLYQSLRILSKKTINKELVRYIFELKLIAIGGEAPQVYECVKCGSKEIDNVFSVSSGGCLCKDCKGTVTDKGKLNESTIYAMQYIISSSIEKLYTFTVTDDVKYELKRLMKKLVEKYSDKKFKSLELI